MYWGLPVIWFRMISICSYSLRRRASTVLLQLMTTTLMSSFTSSTSVSISLDRRSTCSTDRVQLFKREEATSRGVGGVQLFKREEATSRGVGGGGGTRSRADQLYTQLGAHQGDAPAAT